MRLFRQSERTRSQRAELELRHDGEVYRVQLRRIDSARRFILRVRGATRDAVLTMPRRASLKDATAFAERNAAWVGARLRRLPEQVAFADGSIIPLRGVPTRIVHAPGSRGVVWLSNRGDENLLYVAGDAPHVARRVSDWLKAQARRDFDDAVARFARAIGVATPRYSLRDTTSRWGSCSGAGSLNFSWRLIMAPPEVLLYLAAHEVCHLRHMNHSIRFWKLCASICPYTDHAEAWLKAHGPGLHRYGQKPVGAVERAISF
ncbi:MAG: M48 family metallopeptidase [Hyphomicrobiales bacterium]|nr:M48 family metallopeptidase [Hyphomicrobiales bacterium]